MYTMMMMTLMKEREKKEQTKQTDISKKYLCILKIESNILFLIKRFYPCIQFQTVY